MAYTLNDIIYLFQAAPIALLQLALFSKMLSNDNRKHKAKSSTILIIPRPGAKSLGRILPIHNNTVIPRLSVRSYQSVALLRTLYLWLFRKLYIYTQYVYDSLPFEPCKLIVDLCQARKVKPYVIDRAGGAEMHPLHHMGHDRSGLSVD